ncbi:serine/threonine-protein kinase S6KL [Anthonomus grandis grandis]|uniref:serine/threonine-protein kinase S6KL n=1 Tax=Anthonomus grandis grandis TaxID=2921223 RepID=UPI002165793B|nr:serine/threonine-protein kinase S6KL [Anthonomus grandis grandis]
MGNKGSSTKDRTSAVYTSHSLQKKSNSEHNSLKSFLSVDSQESTCSTVSRPWSRVSRRRRQESTLTLPYEPCKTAWPVSQLESLFLPDFPVKNYHKDDKYQKLPQISSGAFGKIYQVKDTEENKIFALKVLSKSKIIENNLVKQVIEEVQIQKACGHHPYITKCLLNWQSRKHLYIATEFVEGGELWYLLDNLGPLPVELVQLYVCQIALALDFLHNAGVIYRDLKPENLLLNKDANIKLIDFGLSKWLPYGHTTRTVCGTPKYMGMTFI